MNYNRSELSESKAFIFVVVASLWICAHWNWNIHIIQYFYIEYVFIEVLSVKRRVLACSFIQPKKNHCFYFFFFSFHNVYCILTCSSHIHTVTKDIWTMVVAGNKINENKCRYVCMRYEQQYGLIIHVFVSAFVWL